MVAARNPTDPPNPEEPDRSGILHRNPTDPPAPTPPPPVPAEPMDLFDSG
jgi:hypothetical protein